MTALKTFCDIDNNIVGYAISAITSSVDPVTCVSSFGLQAKYYDKDWVDVGSSLPVGWELCCCGGGSEPVYLDVDGGVVPPSTPSIVVGAKYDSAGGLDLPTTGAGELIVCSASGGGDGAKASEWAGDWICPETSGTKIYQTAQGLRGVPMPRSYDLDIGVINSNIPLAPVGSADNKIIQAGPTITNPIGNCFSQRVTIYASQYTFTFGPGQITTLSNGIVSSVPDSVGDTYRRSVVGYGQPITPSQELSLLGNNVFRCVIPPGGSVTFEFHYGSVHFVSGPLFARMESAQIIVEDIYV